MIIFTADHGEALGEKNYYFCHGETLHQSQLHVPLIIKHGSDFVGQKTEIAQHVDLVPTILKYIGDQPQNNYRGHDLFAPLPASREVFAELKTPTKENALVSSLLIDNKKLIHTPSQKLFELYDLSQDPGELNNLVGNATFTAQQSDLQARLLRISREDFLALNVKSHEPYNMSEEDMNKLKSLGYIW